VQAEALHATVAVADGEAEDGAEIGLDGIEVGGDQADLSQSEHGEILSKMGGQWLLTSVEHGGGLLEEAEARFAGHEMRRRPSH